MVKKQVSRRKEHKSGTNDTNACFRPVKPEAGIIFFKKADDIKKQTRRKAASAGGIGEKFT